MVIHAVVSHRYSVVNTRIAFKKLETARIAYDFQFVEFKTSCVNNSYLWFAVKVRKECPKSDTWSETNSNANY